MTVMMMMMMICVACVLTSVVRSLVYLCVGVLHLLLPFCHFEFDYYYYFALFVFKSKSRSVTSSFCENEIK